MAGAADVGVADAAMSRAASVASAEARRGDEFKCGECECAASKNGECALFGAEETERSRRTQIKTFHIPSPRTFRCHTSFGASSMLQTNQYLELKQR